MWLLGSGHPVGGSRPGFALIKDNGGFLPLGVLPVFAVFQSVVFAYAGVELVGTTAGETPDPAAVVPRAVRSVSWRIALFYVGSIVMLVLVLPWNRYSASESPFVTVLSKIGLPGAGGIMNLVVLTAAMSSLNSGFYSSGRVLRSMASAGFGPALRRGHEQPAGAVRRGSDHLRHRHARRGAQRVAARAGLRDRGELRVAGRGHRLDHDHALPPGVRPPHPRRGARAPGVPPQGWPWVNVATIAFLVVVILDMGLDGGSIGAWTDAAIPVIAIVLAVGWRMARSRVNTPV